MSTGTGKLDRQHAYYVSAYKLHPGARGQFAGKGSEEQDELMQTPEHVDSLKQFKKDHRSAITSRNRYMQLYEKVGLPIPI